MATQWHLIINQQPWQLALPLVPLSHNDQGVTALVNPGDHCKSLTPEDIKSVLEFKPAAVLQVDSPDQDGDQQMPATIAACEMTDSGLAVRLEPLS